MQGRKPFVCGNWKMYKTVRETKVLLEAVLAEARGIEGVEMGVAPPFTSLETAHAALAGSKILLAAQNVHPAKDGAFTGEISVPMLKDVGCSYVIIGHSERRTLFHETDAGCAEKVSAALEGGLRVILCVGETLAERDAEKTLEVVTTQLLGGLSKVAPAQFGSVVVAYEPVWAIGTGRTATPEQAQEVHAHIRKEIGSKYGAEIAAALRIQYGGSVKPDNAEALFSKPDIDGGLIGGAALKSESFIAICKAAASVAGSA
ncbi:MAG: triose-phosphate isomerase [Deltaproteobacteria bacterium]|nr:triose-phosphate isomerase [Deltaproteobacteria bacterium]